MEYSDNYTEDEEEYFQQETIEETCQESILDTNFKKIIDSDSELSNISSIYRYENENSTDKKSEFLNRNKSLEEYGNDPEDKSEKEYEEELIELDGKLLKNEKNDEQNMSEETFEDSNNIRKNYTFIWSEGGKDVKLTGSFSDWKIKFQMTRDPNENVFKYQMPLGNEIYQYKFIVDGKWKYSKNYPTKEDGNGNINNVLDNTKNTLIQPKNTKNEEKIKESKVPKKDTKNKKSQKKVSKLSTKTKTTKTRATTINKNKIIKKNSIYQSEYPSEDDITPLPLPNEPYYESFKLENFSNQKSIGNKNYYDYYDRYCFSFEASSKPIFILGHVNLNHLISVKNNKSNISKNSMSFRYREKASTFIYYNINKNHYDI